MYRNANFYLRAHSLIQRRQLLGGFVNRHFFKYRETPTNYTAFGKSSHHRLNHLPPSLGMQKKSNKTKTTQPKKKERNKKKLDLSPLLRRYVKALESRSNSLKRQSGLFLPICK